MKGDHIFVLILICALSLTSFFNVENTPAPNILQDTPAQGQIVSDPNISTPLASDSTTNLSDENSSQTVNTNDSQIATNQNNPQDITLLAETDDVSADINVGVNYLSLYNIYSSEYTTDEILHRDFSRFNSDGITVIALSLYWNRLEGNTRGDYNGEYPPDSRGISITYGESFLKDVKRVIGIAADYDIKILLTIHTVWGDGSGSLIPSYVIDPTTGKRDCFAIVRSEEMKQAYIEMFNHTVSYLAGTPNICAWAVLNEPWYYHELDAPKGNLSQKENFIDLIQQLSYIVKTQDGRPVTVRFVNSHNSLDINGLPKVANIFANDWAFDQRIFDAVDFISLNDYMPAYPEVYDDWKEITATNIRKCSEFGKRVWITECGFPPSRFEFVEGANDNAIQLEQYQTFMSFYRSLDVDAIIEWYWRSDNSTPSPGIIGTGRNLCANAKGEPRPAYYELVARPS